VPLVRLRRRVAVLTAVAATALLASAGAAPAQGPAPLYRELHRPQFHFTPAQNWQNDPNGLVYYQGEYHMFYQYNPLGSVWGNISWGHAVSRDLVHWTELGVALPFTEEEAAWSGSVVVDTANTTGFGTPGNPAMVAIYTIANPLTGFSQAQGLAYSVDRGRTWTKYAGNPVLDIDDPQFRDPKVFWHEPTRRWIMPVALSLQRKISIYSSPDLKAWTKESDFGPAGAITGVYEVPDLVPLTVTGRNATESKWALIVNVNPGARLGGSGAQYFLGDFDGKRFVADEEEPYVAPEGDVLADFEGADHGGWTATGTAFGTGPAPGALAGQRPVVGFLGSGLINSYADGTAAEGTLTSPEFTITRDHINFLVGGGDLPALAGVAAEATVNLLVDGQVVRSATGDGSEWLDWAGWDVRDLRDRTAQIQLVDRAGGARGFILVDQITQADELATSGTDRARWVDWGRDFYASITYDGEPSGRRILVGWLNNWLYASTIPTSPWRGTQSAPRVLSLRRTGDTIDLIQEPARELRRLRREPPHVVRGRRSKARGRSKDPGRAARRWTSRPR
jgi:beta-fructofuranosidase/levanase